MKTTCLLSLYLLFVTSCTKPIKEDINTQFLNGYWEIDRVTASNGSEKHFNYNEVIDYFETKDSTGFRAKVKPNLKGTYTSNFQKLEYNLVKKNDTLLIKYQTINSPIIVEKLFRANKNQLSIKTEDGNIYHYKPYTPINL